ncbi:hypothetical protein ACTMU2_16280 [Cupriavidus basilensis]
MNSEAINAKTHNDIAKTPLQYAGCVFASCLESADLRRRFTYLNSHDFFCDALLYVENAAFAPGAGTAIDTGAVIARTEQNSLMQPKPSSDTSRAPSLRVFIV